jgi:negative regulator of flagellin synthesis FlgM
MRISAHDQHNVIQPQNTVRENGEVARSTATEGKDSAEGVSADRVELSSRAQDIQRARDIAQQAPEVREDRIAAAKRALESGELKLSGADLAEKLLQDRL